MRVQETKPKLNFDLKLKIRSEAASVVLDLTPAAPHACPYRLENRLVNYVLLVRQRGVEGYNWKTLNPGESMAYAWEEPLVRPARLLLKVGRFWRDRFEVDHVEALSTRGGGAAARRRRRRRDRLRGWLGLVPGEDALPDLGPAKVLSLDKIGLEAEVPTPGAARPVHAQVVSEGATKVLRVTDTPGQSAEDQAQRLRGHLARVAVHLDLERARRDDYRAIKERIDAKLAAVRADASPPPPPPPGADPDAYDAFVAAAAQHPPREEPAAAAARLAALCRGERAQLDQRVREDVNLSHLPRVTAPGQLFVQVLEGHGLGRAGDPIAGAVDPYVELHLHTPDRRRYRAYRQRRRTYFLEKTRDPRWEQQAFVLRVPPQAERTWRGFSLRAVVRDRSALGPSEALGRADVQLSLLQDEEERVGWFPLARSAGRLGFNGLGNSYEAILGSLKLRVVWIRTLPRLAAHCLSQAEDKVLDLEALKEEKEELLRRLESARVERRGAGGRLTHQSGKQRWKRGFKQVKLRLRGATGKLHRGLHVGAAVERRRARSSVALMKIEGSPGETQASLEGSFLNDGSGSFPELLTVKGSKPKVSVFDIAELVKLSQQDDQIRESLALLPDPAFSIRRPPPFERAMFLREARNAHDRVMHAGGTLIVRPVKALLDSTGNQEVYVQVRYGSTLLRSERAASPVSPTWSYPEEDVDESPRGSSQRGGGGGGGGGLRLPVAQQHRSGAAAVALWARGKRALALDRELGRLELPIARAIDCCCEGTYRRWFPMLAPEEAGPLDGDEGAGMRPHQSEQERATHIVGTRAPVLELELEWQPDPQPEELTKQYFSVQLEGLSISLIDSVHAKELLHLTVSEADGRFSRSADYARTGLALNWVQLDHQEDGGGGGGGRGLAVAGQSGGGGGGGADSELGGRVVLQPTPVRARQPTLQAVFIRDERKSGPALSHYEYAAVLLQELDLRLDQRVLASLWGFAGSRRRGAQARAFARAAEDGAAFANGFQEAEEAAGGADPAAAAAAAAAAGGGGDSGDGGGGGGGGAGAPSPAAGGGQAVPHKIYMEDFKLFSIKINLSFLKVFDSSSTLMPGVPASRGDELSPRGLIVSTPLNLLLRMVEDFLMNLTSSISDAPVVLKGVEITHLWTYPDRLVRSLQDHYSSAGLRQLYKVLGALDIVGNPIGLLSHLGTGVRDFFNEPVQAVIKSPTQIGRGLAKGTVSLVSNTTAGVFGAAAGMARGVANGMAALSMDDAYRARRARLAADPRRAGPLRPAKAFALGVVCGVTGVVTEPYSGARKHGAAGAAVGLGAGLVGAAAKPVAGALDAATYAGEAAGEGCTALAGRLAPKFRKEAPRGRWRLAAAFGPDRRLQAHDPARCRGAALLRRFHPGSQTVQLLRQLQAYRDFLRDEEEGQGGGGTAGGGGGGGGKGGEGGLAVPPGGGGGGEGPGGGGGGRPRGTGRRTLLQRLAGRRAAGGGGGGGGRGEELSLHLADGGFDEVLVTTEIIQSSQNILDFDIIVVSNQRILVVKAIREKQSYDWVFKWEMFFEAMTDPPLLHEQDAQTLALTFTTVKEKNHMASRNILARMGMKRRLLQLSEDLLAARDRTEHVASVRGAGLAQDILRNQDGTFNPDLETQQTLRARTDCSGALARVHNACCCLLGHYGRVVVRSSGGGGGGGHSHGHGLPTGAFQEGVSRFGIWEFEEEQIDESKGYEGDNGSLSSSNRQYQEGKMRRPASSKTLVNTSQERKEFVLEGADWHPGLLLAANQVNTCLNGHFVRRLVFFTSEEGQSLVDRGRALAAGADEAVRAMAEARRMLALAAPGPADPPAVRRLKDDLWEGTIGSEEFEERLEMELQKHASWSELSGPGNHGGRTLLRATSEAVSDLTGDPMMAGEMPPGVEGRGAAAGAAAGGSGAAAAAAHPRRWGAAAAAAAAHGRGSLPGAAGPAAARRLISKAAAPAVEGVMGAKKHVAKVGKQVKGLLRSGGRAAAGSPSMDPGRQPSAAGRTVGEPGHPSDVDDTGDQLQLLQAQLAQLAQQNRELAQHVLFQQQQGQQWAAGAAAAAVAAPAPPPLVTAAGTGGRRLAAIPAAGGGPAAAATAESAPPLASPGRLKAGGGVPDAPQVGVYFTAPPPVASPGSGHAHFIGGQQVFLASNGYNSVQGGGPLFLPGGRTPLEHLTFTHPPQHFFPEEPSLGSNPLATGAGSGQSAAQGREEKHGHENGNKLRGLEFGTIAGREEQQDDQCSSPGHGITNPAYYNGQHQDRSNENQGGCGSVEEVNSYTSDDVASDNVVSSYDDDEEERCFSPTNNGEDDNRNKEESSSSSSRTFI